MAKFFHIAGEHDNIEFDELQEGYRTIVFADTNWAYPIEFTVDEVHNEYQLSESEVVERAQLANEQIIAAGIKRALRPLIRKWADPRTFRITMDADENIITFSAKALRFTPPGVDRDD